MTDPVMLAVATAVATKAAEGLTEGGRSALAALVRLVRGRLRDHDESAVLDSAEAEPADDDRVGHLAAALERAASRDPRFADELGRLWRGLRETGSTAVDGGVVNQASGPVSGTVVQARDVQGGIVFGAPAPVDPGRR
ncbi:hypothetical protein AB0J86_17390 [Micromonospora sp. NPDC049559]|uniref:hypothetical protein n=1 Tax=Micromonospora sp. NPDC049559 TaxID=3155923 RepID=UPI003435C5A2